jgi:type II secretory pathway pseudopilin PulG
MEMTGKMKTKNTSENVLFSVCSVKNYTGGFTMMEIMVVVIIAILFVVLAVPGMMHMFNVYNANGAADQMRGDIRYAENLAITNVNNYYMQLNLATGTPNNPSIDNVPNSYVIYYIISTTASIATTVVKNGYYE